MFWANNYVSSPHIEALLNKEDVTLHELMDEEDILQECKSQNKKLVDYLTRPKVMEELVTLTTREPSLNIDERWRYKYSNVACELLTSEVPTLNEKLAGDETLLSKLYAFIDTDEPLNPLLASFFSKTIGVLVARKSDQNWYSYQFTCLQVLEFLKSRQRCVDLLLRHLETSAIMDLILKLVTQVEGNDMRQNILTWLDSQDLVQRLVQLLSPSAGVTRHANAAQLLCDMVKGARENRNTMERVDPDPILYTLESDEIVTLLLETILTGEKMESSIVGGIQVLLVLLGQKASNVTNEGDVQGIGAGEDFTDNKQRTKISIATLPYLEHFHQLLLDPPKKPAVKTTAGILECPLGNTRLHVAKLLTSLLSTENPKIREKLAELGTFQTLLDLFFKYSWNNFLHTQVEQCLALAINSTCHDTNDIIYPHLFIKCRLIDRILEAWDKNDNKQNTEKGVRQGYMGHLINIANNIVAQCEESNVNNFLQANLSSECLNKWEALVSNQLAEINKTHQIQLGGIPQTCMTNSDENPNEYNTFSHDAYMQQAYTNYQEQQMTPQLIENYGYHDDEFNDGDDTLANSVDQLNTVAFNLTEEDLDKGEEMFNQICQQKQRAGIEESSGTGEWNDDGELTFQTVIDKRDWPTKQQHHDSNSSDEDEDDPHDLHMEVDDIFSNVTEWDSTEPLSTNVVLPKVNPWDVVPSEPVEQSGWANFDNFESSLNIDGIPETEAKASEHEVQANKQDNTTGGATTDDKSISDKNSTSAGDTVKIDANDTVLPSHDTDKTTTNRKINEDQKDSVNTADSNANPSETSDSGKTDSKSVNDKGSRVHVVEIKVATDKKQDEVTLSDDGATTVVEAESEKAQVAAVDNNTSIASSASSTSQVLDAQ
ncbi:serine/threonine-protein phosphatase 6 regulatory subunit 3 isoform X2 [Cephus cinctus]|uniref:Serine/threonine-protein phosphatase 6 regulatory subunit 3 isoform X2 n=1 Tax=Cephus cinctus TaxID=211228 RepID=A0AAJ7W4G0_CEPCN|nr:serine/threonine-protein phosphatase 6 regulatory subunit 3 isoform X2 [Cephus cinctus]